MTVGIDDENGLAVGYGVIPNVSETGACVWTDSHLAPGRQLVLRISFAHPAEVHEVTARVVWTGEGVDSSGARMRRYGLMWHEFSSACVRRLRDLAPEAFGDRRTGSHPAVTPSAGLDAP